MTRITVVFDGDLVRGVQPRRRMSTKQQTVLRRWQRITRTASPTTQLSPYQLMMSVMLMIMMMMSIARVQLHPILHYRNSCCFHLKVKGNRQYIALYKKPITALRSVTCQVGLQCYLSPNAGEHQPLQPVQCIHKDAS